MPHKLPLHKPAAAGSPSRPVLVIQLPSDELSVSVGATVVDERTIACIVPDMSELLCDGPVLVEVCMCGVC